MSQNENALSVLSQLFTSSNGGLVDTVPQFLKYALQLEGHQSRALILLVCWRDWKKYKGELLEAQRFDQIYKTFMELKQYQGSDIYAMSLLKQFSMYDFVKGMNLSVDKKV